MVADLVEAPIVSSFKISIVVFFVQYARNVRSREDVKIENSGAEN